MRTIYLTLAACIMLNTVFAQVPEDNIILRFIDPDISRCASGDINNDGVIDLVAGYYQIHWFEGNGTYSLGTLHNTGAELTENVTDLRVVDIDNDGWQDIWYQKGVTPYEVGWLKNPGVTDQYWAQMTISGSYKNVLGIFDMNGDGVSDFVFEDSGYMLGYREIGDGHFSAYHSIPDSWSNVQSFSSEDLDADDDVDVVVYCYDSGVKYWRNNSNGTFTSTNIKNSETDYDVYSGDVNGDNYPDILYNNGSFYVSTFDTITSTFAPGVYNGDMDDFDFRMFKNLDLDHDGDKDFVIVDDNYIAGESTYEISWLESNGSLLHLNVANFESLIDGLPYYNTCMNFVDVNNDATPDFFQCESGTYGTTAIVNPNIGGIFGAYDSSFIALSPKVEDLIVYDVDEDPDNDLLLAFDNGLLSWYEFNHLVDSFTTMHNINFTDSRPNPTNIKKKDLDSDGDFDVISSFAYGYALPRTFYHLNLGGGNFETYTICDTAFSNAWLLDGDDDGDLDLAGLITGSPNRLLYFTNNGIADHMFSYTADLTAYGYYNSFISLDIDSDGDEDLAGVRDDANGVKKILNTDGALLFDDISNLFVTACDNVKSLFSSDLDNDGDKDFAYVCGDGTMYMMLDNGAGYTESSIGTFDPATLSDGAHTAMFDMNMDGLEDFVFNKTTGGSGFKLATGPGTFQEDYDLYSTDYGRFANLDAGALPDFIGISNSALYVEYNILMLPPSFEIGAPTGELISEGGATDSIVITFNTIPQEALEINITPDGALNAGAGNGVAFTMTIANDSSALEPHVIHLTTNEDTAIEDIAHNGISIQADPVSWGGFADLLDLYYNFTITDNDLGIFVTNDAISLEEGIWSDTIFAHVNVIPTSDVVVTASFDPEYTTGFGADLTETFTILPGILGTNAFQITLFHPEDVLFAGDIITNLSLQLTSDDAVFNGYTQEIIPVTLVEDDSYGINTVISTTELSEGIESATLEISPLSAPTESVTITLTPDDYLDLGNGIGEAIALTFAAGVEIPEMQTISAFAADNYIAEGTHSASIVQTITSDDAFYGSIAPLTYIFTISDNDLPQGITFTPPAATTYMEGTTDINMSFALWTNPAEIVQITAQPDMLLDLGSGAGNPITITFDPMDDATIPQLIAITAANNTIIGPEMATANITFEINTADLNLVDETIDPITLTIQDEDMLQGIQIAAPAPITYIEGEEDITMSLMLNTIPNALVTINCTPDAQLDLGAGAGVPITLSLEGVDATIPHELLIDIIDDAIIEGLHSGMLTFEIITDDPILMDTTILPIELVIDDNDFPQTVIITFDALYHSEGETLIPLSASLESAPEFPVDLLLSPAEDIDLGAGSGVAINIHFNADGSAMIPQELFVSVADNFIVDGDRTSNILAELTTIDPELIDYIVPAIPVYIHDNDILQGVNISTPEATPYTEGTIDIPIAVSLFTIPNAPVSIIADYDLAQLSMTTTSLNFATDGTAMESQYFHVSVNDDLLVEGDHFALINYTIVTDDPQFDGYSIPFAVVNIADNDIETAIHSLEEGALPTAVMTSGQFQIHVSNALNGSAFVIIAMNGQRVLNGNIAGNILSADTGTLPAGRYAIGILMENDILNIPLIVTH